MAKGKAKGNQYKKKARKGAKAVAMPMRMR